MTHSEGMDAFRKVVGPEYVTEERSLLGSYETATFHTTHQVLAVVRPATVAQVQACVDVARHHDIRLYPISTGLNTGYGSAVPTAPDCVILELSRLDRIVDYSEELGYVTVEPGVTQQQLYDFLEAKDAPYWLDVTGASPRTSPVGNLAERGFGHTLYADHFAHIGGMEVVLANGELLATGFGQYDNARATGVYRWGLGPHLDGLFTQSNLGIIVRATLWLMPKPPYMQFFACRIESDEDLPDVIDRLRPLRLDGTIPSAMHIGNDYKIISAIQGYPWEEAGDVTPLPEAVRKERVRAWDCGPWNVSGALYGTRATVADARRRIRSALRGKVRQLRFLDERLLGLAERFARPYQLVTGVNLGEMMRMVKPVFGMTRGIPSAGMLPSNYWRKHFFPAPSPDLSPERDHCGVMWLAPVAPATGEHARALWSIVRETMIGHGYEPSVSITLISGRALDCVVNIAYDRETAGEDERAMACHDDLLGKLCDAGYYPYRLGVQSMDKMPPRTLAWQRFTGDLRNVLDPRGILAPGRYLP